MNRQWQVWRRIGCFGKMHSGNLGASLIFFMFFLIVFLSFISPHKAFANEAPWILKKIGDNAVTGTARWCGSGNVVVWQGATSGIHLADLSAGSEKAITTSWQHVNPTCLPDGRYVLFEDESDRKTKTYELASSKIKTIECLNKKVVLSPDMKMAASVDIKACESIGLPWGETIPIKKITNVSLVGYSPPSIVGWFPNKQKIILSFIELLVPGTFTQHIQLAAYDLVSAKLTLLPIMQGSSLVKFTEDSRYVYFAGGPQISLKSPMPPSHLYRVNIEKEPLKAELLKSEIVAFDVHPQRGVLLLNKHGILTLDEKGLKQLAQLKNANAPKFSPEGSKILLTKQNKFHGEDGPEGPPITSSVYILVLTQN